MVKTYKGKESAGSRKAFPTITLAIVLLGVLLITLQSGDLSKLSPWVCALFVVISLFAAIQIMADTAIYSLNKVHWFFIYVFMGIAPLSQYTLGYYPHNYYVSDDTMMYAELLVLLWCVCYSAARGIRKNPTKIESEVPLSDGEYERVIPVSRSLPTVLVCASTVAVVVLAYKVRGFSNLFLRGEAWIEIQSPVDTVLGYLLRAIPVFSLAILLVSKKRSRNFSTVLEMLWLLILTLAANYPVSLSRYWTGVVYIGLILCAVPVHFFRKRRFDLILVIGICVIFPMMYQLKFVTVDEYLHTELTSFFSNYSSVYNSPDFDAFSMLSRTLLYVDSQGFSFGRQIVGSIFFFVPRAVLSIKGTASGSLVSSFQGDSYTNLSEPLIAEGFIDFGVFGVILYAVVMAKIVRYFDRKYWGTFKDSTRKVTYHTVITPFLVGFVVFIMRGALQPVVLRIFGFYLFLIIIYVVDHIFTRKRERRRSSHTTVTTVRRSSTGNAALTLRGRETEYAQD